MKLHQKNENNQRETYVQEQSGHREWLSMRNAGSLGCAMSVHVILQMAATMADVFSDPNDKIRNPTSSLSNFKNRLAQIQDINVLGLVT